MAEYNIGLAEKDSDSFLTNDELHKLIVQTYEALIGEIDISQSNPNFAGSDISKKYCV